MPDFEPSPITIEGVKTLPLYILMGKSRGAIGPYGGKGTVDVHYLIPEKNPSTFPCNTASRAKASDDWEYAISAVKGWSRYCTELTYLLQFLDDSDRELIRSLDHHTELLSLICDLRLNLDPTILSETLGAIVHMATVQEEYRQDPEREENYAEHVRKYDKAYDKYMKSSKLATKLIKRMLRQMTARRGDWPRLHPLGDTDTSLQPATLDGPGVATGEIADLTPRSHTGTPSPRPSGLKVFYSYSHKDEILRDKLETHLASLRREGLISSWYDRRITGGKEWESEIDAHEEQADVILLLVSADFIHSEYCFGVEVASALRRHESGESRVIPIILRDCDWTSSVIGKLQALPKDRKPVTSWANEDEAFTDIAKRLRAVIEDLASNEVVDPR